MYFPHHDISFDGNWFLRVMVPPIVFEAALSIDKRSFHRHGVPILIYAVVGTLVATALTALVVHKGSSFFRGCETIPLIEALTFGALISSIDPIAVLSVLNNMGMTDTDTIYILIFGESLLNDGVAIVLFETLVHFLDESIQVDGHAMAAASLHFLVVAIGSLVVGGLSGGCCTIYYWAMHGCQTPLVEVLMFFCWALLPYYICDGIEWSGIVAVVATGFVLDLYVVGQAGDNSTIGEEEDSSPQKLKSNPTTSPRSKQQLNRRRRPMFSRVGHLSGHAKTHIGFVTEILATTMETAIFAYLGLFLFNSRYHWNFYHTGLAILGCCLSRAIMIPMLSFLANSITRTQRGFLAKCGSPLPQQTLSPKGPPGVVIDRKMQLVLWFAGLRGAMSFALVENIPLYDAETGEGSRLKSELKAMTSACIFFTVFVLGGSTFYLMEMIGMAPTDGTNSATKDTEMVGLLSKNLSGDDEDKDFAASQGSLDFHHARDGKTPNIFRQRIQQAPA
jgi:NhaP-type Na+/H+ or K+/H+ antiporter